MKKFLIILTAILQAVLASAQQVDTTGIYSEKKDSLSAAGVVAQRTLVKLEADRLTYDVANDIDSKSMTVLEMLRKIPMVTVGADDKITVNGSSSFKVYVDGRPDQMLTTSPTQMFRAMPASNIKSIEVITNPGAKYDAEGVGGVLEIKTISGSRRALSNGIYGNVMARGNTLGDIYGSGSLHAQLGKWTVSAQLQPSHYNTSGLETVSELEATGRSYKKNTLEDILNNSNTGAFSASFEPDTLNLFSASFGLNHSPNRGGMNEGHFESGSSSGMLYSYDMNANYHETGGYVMGSLDWQHRFKQNSDRILTLSWQASDNPAQTRDTTFITNIRGTLPFEADNVILVKDNKSLENTLQADFITPLGPHQSFITGAKLILRHFRTDATDGVTPVNYDYHSNIGAAYAEYTGAFGRFTLKGGLRYEHTWQDYSQAGQDFRLDYGNFVPSASIQYDLGPRSNLSFSYNNRISRPGISYLSPYVNRSDPNNISYGNPKLEAENGHRISLIYNLSSPKWVVSVRVADHFSGNGIYRYTILNGDISESTYGNIVSRNAFGANVYVNWNATGKTRIFFSADGACQQFLSDVLDQKNEGFGISTLFGFQQVLPWDIRLSSNLSLSTKTYSLQGWTQNPAYLGIRLAKAFLDDRLVFTLSGVTNFEKGKAESKSFTEGSNFATTEITRTPWRNIGLSIGYTFGKKQISVKRTSRSIVNDDLVGDVEGSSSQE